MKKILVFDLDDTLAVSKSAISDQMAELLAEILNYYQVCVITGGKIEQIKQQVINPLTEKLSADQKEKKLTKIHLMPTCGTCYYRYSNQQWQLEYQEDLTDQQKAEIFQVIEEEAKKIGLWEENPDGQIIEDRLSQVTYSALGQQATPEKKYQWAEKNQSKRLKLRQQIADRLPDLEVRVGGTTSIDITKIGIDKAYGVSRLIELNELTKDELLFFGDKLQPGGNDYPVQALGVDSIEVAGWQTTAYVLRGVLGVTDES